MPHCSALPATNQPPLPAGNSADHPGQNGSSLIREEALTTHRQKFNSAESQAHQSAIAPVAGLTLGIKRAWASFPGHGSGVESRDPNEAASNGPSSAKDLSQTQTGLESTTNQLIGRQFEIIHSQHLQAPHHN
jgi:hypothetical protein